MSEQYWKDRADALERENARLREAKSVLDEIRCALEEHGYVHMANGDGIRSLIQDNILTDQPAHLTGHGKYTPVTIRSRTITDQPADASEPSCCARTREEGLAEAFERAAQDCRGKAADFHALGDDRAVRSFVGLADLYEGFVKKARRTGGTP